ncbi:uncharacterized protein ACIBXB_011229 isoform 1-T2 [Morphnus guianensis]
MPNTTTSWHSLKSAARHRDRQEVCNAAAPGCALCCPADSDPRRSVSGGPGGSGHGDARPVPHACRAAQENPAAAARPPTPAAAASAGSWRLDRQGAGSIPCFPWLPLLSWPGLPAPSVRPSSRVQDLEGQRSHTRVPTWGALCSRRGWQSGCTWHPAHTDLLRAPAHTCMNMRARAHTDTRVQLRTHTHTHIIHAHTCMDIHIHAHIHINVYSCTSMHTRMRCPSTHTEPSPQLLPCPCPDVCHPPPQQHRPPAPHAWPCPPRNAPGLLGWAPGPGSPPPACPCQLVAMCGAAAAEYTAPAIRLAACQGRGLLRPPPATAQRDAGVKAGRERGFPSPCSHLPAPCLLCQGLAQPQLCPGHRLHMPLCRGRNSPRSVPGPGEGRGPSRGPMHGEGWRGTELARDTSPWQCGHPAQPCVPPAPAGPPTPGMALSPPLRDLQALRRQTNGEGKQGRGVPLARGCLRPTGGGRGAVCSQPAGRVGSKPVPVLVLGSTAVPAVVPAATSPGTYWESPGGGPTSL